MSSLHQSFCRQSGSVICWWQELRKGVSWKLKHTGENNKMRSCSSPLWWGLTHSALTQACGCHLLTGVSQRWMAVQGRRWSACTAPMTKLKKSNSGRVWMALHHLHGLCYSSGYFQHHPDLQPSVTSCKREQDELKCTDVEYRWYTYR